MIISRQLVVACRCESGPGSCPGSADLATLDQTSRMIGQFERQRTSVSIGGRRPNEALSGPSSFAKRTKSARTASSWAHRRTSSRGRARRAPRPPPPTVDRARYDVLASQREPHASRCRPDCEGVPLLGTFLFTGVILSCLVPSRPASATLFYSAFVAAEGHQS